jgi:hypothetical protein
VSDWTYVALAFTVVWGALAIYALILARRVTQARIVADGRPQGAAPTEAHQTEPPPQDRDSAVCDAPPAP